MKLKIRLANSLSIIALVAMFLYPVRLRAQEDTPVPLDAEATRAMVDSIAAGYYPWDKISMSGKLSSPMLPVTVSAKVYMEKDSLILISLAAPIIGEAARIEIDPQKALVVNKLKNSYATVDMAQVESLCPGGISLIQNMLMGRISILGQGELTPEMAPLVNVFDSGNDSWVLLPEQDLENAPYVYFYTLSMQGLQLERVTLLTQPEEGQVTCAYASTPQKLTLNFLSTLGGKPMEATLTLNNPDSKAKPMERFELSQKYRETNLKGVMR